MTWHELSHFLHSQRLSLEPRPISDFARIGEQPDHTFKRLEKTTRKSLDKAVRKFAKSRNWPFLSDEAIVILYFRLSYGVDLAVALSTGSRVLFPTLKNREADMIQWALNKTWHYPGLPHTLRMFSEKRRAYSADATRN